MAATRMTRDPPGIRQGLRPARRDRPRAGRGRLRTSQLGGYFLIEASDLDAAIAWAARCPAASHGTVEIRPVWT